MSQQLKFNHVLLILLALAAICSITLPAAVGDAFRGKVDNLFWPVAALTRAVASAVDGKFTSAPPAPTDTTGKPKTPAELQDEVDSLKYLYSNVKQQLDDLRQRNNEMAGLGPAADFSIPFRTFAGDAGTRQTLSLTGSSFSGLRADMAVIYKYGIVGRLQIVGMSAARVLLITDPQAKAVQCSFIRFPKDNEPVKVMAPPFTVAAGDKPGTLKVTTFKMTDVGSEKDGAAVKVKVGDTVLLNDKDWPDVVQGLPVGDVLSITPQRKNILFADIVIKPKAELMKLNQVMVVNPELRPVTPREPAKPRTQKK